MNDPSQQHIGTPALIRRFAPYLMRYKCILIFDLFCAALTTLCDIVLPKIMSYLTNAATDPGIVLTVDAVLCPAPATSWAFTLRPICGGMPLPTCSG